MDLLREWESFYVIVGSSAGALIGLQFVVVALIAELPIAPGDESAGEAFATPTIVHLGSVLFLSAVLSAPWHTLQGVAIVWGLSGLAGTIYALIVMRRQHTQTAYKPVFEDWLFHTLLPITAYVIITVAALLARAHERGALFTVAGASLLLLFIGIHNAWDSVSYMVFVRVRKHQEKKRQVSTPQ